MEKTKYELPIIEVIDIDKNDAITTSGPLTINGKWYWGVDGEDGEEW